MKLIREAIVDVTLFPKPYHYEDRDKTPQVYQNLKVTVHEWDKEGNPELVSAATSALYQTIGGIMYRDRVAVDEIKEVLSEIETVGEPKAYASFYEDNMVVHDNVWDLKDSELKLYRDEAGKLTTFEPHPQGKIPLEPLVYLGKEGEIRYFSMGGVCFGTVLEHGLQGRGRYLANSYRAPIPQDFLQEIL